MAPLVTIFLVTYNHVNTFKKAIESVLTQKTNFEYKIIVLDDASTDGTSDIVREYSHLPNVKTIIRGENCKGQNLYLGLKEELNTKYYTVLETDDYWCDDTKLQQQVDALEANPDCSFCAHNTIVNYINSGKTKLYLNSPTKIFTFPKKLTNRYYIEPHTSSRVYRSELLELDKIKAPIIATYDIANNFYFLTKGNLYYINEVMSAYNYNEKGVYSGAYSYKQRYKSASVIGQLNKEFDYKYNYLLSRFFSTRLNLCFFNYWILKLNKNPKKLESLYEKTLKNYETKYLNNRDKKPICQINIPINKKTSLVFELRREKERA